MGKAAARTKRDVVLSVGYYKAGDDFAEALERAKGDPVAALAGWASALDESAGALRRVAEALKGSGVMSAMGDTHHVEIHDVPEALLPALVATGIAYCREDDPFEDEGEGEEG